METSSVFKNAIISEFAFLKETATLEELYTRGIKLGPSGGLLLPVCRLQADDPHLITMLSTWRRENSIAYPTRFPVTDSGTAKWLTDKLLNVPDRILFLVKDRHGRDIGHLGFANCLNTEGLMEVDNVVRGVSGATPGIMNEAMIALMSWARTTIWPSNFHLRVIKSNAHAIQFYKALGFLEVSRTPLRLTTRGEISELETVGDDDAHPPDDYFIRMEAASEPGNPPGKRMILTAGPSISSREASFAFDAAKYGWNDQWSKYIKTFEHTFADYVGVKHAISTSSCTGALHIALAALGIGPGDEVIVPDITWVSTANAVLYVGATPVFADVNRDTWLIDPSSVRTKLSTRTKAIIPVHLYGHPCDMDQIMAISSEKNLYVVEDAAPSIGAEYHGRKTGSFGHFACFSFQGAKLAVTGEGGMLVTNDSDLYHRAYEIWDQGRKPGTFWIQSNGLKYKMANVQAAIGLGQIQRNDSMIEAKRRIFDWYDQGLEGIPNIALCREPEGTKSIYWMSSLQIKEEARVSRDQLIAELKDRNVDTRPVFPAISQYPIWPCQVDALPIAKFIGDHGINLPSGVCLRREEVNYICSAIRKILK